MDKKQIEKEVNWWNGNLGTFEVYDRLREMLEHQWHRDAVDHKGEITEEDIGKILAYAYEKYNMDYIYTEMAITLDSNFHGVEKAYEAARASGAGEEYEFPDDLMDTIGERQEAELGEEGLHAIAEQRRQEAL